MLIERRKCSGCMVWNFNYNQYIINAPNSKPGSEEITVSPYREVVSGVHLPNWVKVA